MQSKHLHETTSKPGIAFLIGLNVSAYIVVKLIPILLSHQTHQLTQKVDHRWVCLDHLNKDVPFDIHLTDL